METNKQKLLIKTIIIVVLACLSWLIGYFTGLGQGQEKALPGLTNKQQNVNQQNGLPQIPPPVGDSGQNANPGGLPQIPPLIK
ncbi:MAG: hypothetical protein NTZ18_02965 [Candidatus Komeilibacteria bacterium]|nr:hypothetical protein [Candidatus Komeilibacteria bacterium]